MNLKYKMNFLDPPVEDFGSRPSIYGNEDPIAKPTPPPPTYEFAALTTISDGFVEQPGEYIGGISAPVVESSRVIPPDEISISLFSVPITTTADPALVRDPAIWFNSTNPHYIPNGADISGGGGSTPDLSQVLAVGNSAGIYDIDMNSNQIVNTIGMQAKPGQDFNIVNTTNDVNLAGAMVNLTAGTDVNIIATQMNMGMGKIVNLATPTDASGAATKGYVDSAISGVTPSNWSAYPATQDVDFDGFQQLNVQFINALQVQDNPIFLYNPYQLGYNTTDVNAVVIAGGDNRTDISNNGVGVATQKNITRGIVDTGVGENIGAFTMFGKDLADNDIPYAAVRGVCTDPATANPKGRLNLVVRDNTTNRVLMQLDASANTISVQGTSATTFDMNAHKIINLATPTDPSGAATKAYVDAAVVGGAQSLAQVLAVGNTAGTNIDMSQNDIINVNDITNISGTLNIGANDLNLSATGLTSVLNINSVFGTAIVAGGAVDITAGGTTAINSTGNITIGSLGTTSIENFNLSNSVLTKVPATSDLQLNNISLIRNATAVIDISSSQVNVNSFQFGSSTLSAPGATRLTLDDVQIINNDASGGAVEITAATVRNNAFQFAGPSGNIMTTNGANLQLNDIEFLNKDSGPGSITSYQTIIGNQSNLVNPVAFKTAVNTNGGSAIGFQADAVTTSDLGETAVGVYVNGPEANNTNGNAVGLSVQTVLGGLTTGNTATGVEVWGSFTGDIKRGFWEHSASANVKNTFMNPVGVGTDPSGYVLDVSGQANISAPVGGRANPTLTLESTSAAAPGAYLQFYHNSATPANGDRAGVMDMYGKNNVGAKYEVARIRTLQQDISGGAEDGSIELWATNAGSITHYMDIDGSNNAVIVNPNKDVAGASFKIFDSQGVTTNNTLMNADCSNATVMFKGYPQTYIYDISGVYTLTLPNAWNIMRFVAYGAGGGGGGGAKGASSLFGGGAGAGGNGVEIWYSRRELMPDASGSATLYITVGKGGDGGAAITAAGNGNNGSAGGTTFVNMDIAGAGATQQLYYQLTGGNGGSGGTGAAGTGGTGATFSGGTNVGSSGRSGASSSITAQPTRNTTVLPFCGTMYCATGGSGAGGGVNSVGTTAYNGGIFVSPAGQKYNGFGVNVDKQGNANTGTAGGIVSFDNLPNAAVRPLSGMGSVMAGGGASTNVGQASGNGGGWTAGTAGSRGDGGGGGGANASGSTTAAGAGGRGADGFVFMTLW